MKSINDLINKYPQLLGCLQFGCEVGNGWFDLIDKLCEDIIKLDQTIVATQVKEKFGTLRFYVDSAPDDVYDLIDKAECVSGSICEQCGEPGKRASNNMWLKTLCKKCTIDEK